ncbi:hypothetical protein ACP70R_020909 [Stipagrostis hirtigluma subsp. patula]
MGLKHALFLALSLLLVAGAVHACGPNCPSPAVPTPFHSHKCPIDALKLRVCANVLGLVKVGLPAPQECCPLLKGLVDLDAAVCLCTALKADVLGVNLNVPVSLSLILNKCDKICPADFTCPK